MIPPEELRERIDYDGDGDFGCALCGLPGHFEKDEVWCEGGCDPADVTALVDRWSQLPLPCPKRFDASHPRAQCLRCRRREAAVADEERILRVEAQDPDGEGWASEDLSEAEDVPEPSVLIVGDEFILRRGWKHLVHGPFGSGKTPFCYIAVAEEVQKGNLAMIIDYEMGKPGATALLRELGLTREQLRNQVWYRHQPPEINTKRRRRVMRDLARMAEATGGELTVVVIDSLSESMATVPGASDNDSLDVAAWGQNLPDWLASDVGAAVLIIDHSNLTDGERPSGSHKKREMVQFHLHVKNMHDFSREQPLLGESEIVVMKDRSGQRPLRTPVASLRTWPNGSFYVTPPAVSTSGEVVVDGTLQPEGGTKEEVYADLVAVGIEGILKTPLLGRGSRGDYRRSAFDMLVAEGRAVERPDPSSNRARRCWADVHAPE